MTGKKCLIDESGKRFEGEWEEIKRQSEEKSKEFREAAAEIFAAKRKEFAEDVAQEKK
jgi:hypothetical protein